MLAVLGGQARAGGWGSRHLGAFGGQAAWLLGVLNAGWGLGLKGVVFGFVLIAPSQHTANTPNSHAAC